MTKLVSGLLVLRQGNSSDWTSDLDSQMQDWVLQYIQWLETAPIAIQEQNSTK